METLFTTILAFISTNIDDVFLLMLFYAGRKFSRASIIAGQYVGIGTLVIVSFLGAYVGSYFDLRYVGLLGLFPIYLAVRQTMELFRKDDNEDDNSSPAATGLLAIAGVTIANGGDNIGVYIPLLTTMSIREWIQLIVVFAIATYLLCLLAQYLARHPIMAKHLDKYGHIATPIVLFLLGVFILFESGTFSLIPF